jgi:hypothetical protein
VLIVAKCLLPAWMMLYVEKKVECALLKVLQNDSILGSFAFLPVEVKGCCCITTYGHFVLVQWRACYENTSPIFSN